MDQLPRLGKRELICLLLFTCNYVVFVWRGFLFLWVLVMGYVILLWHSLSLPYNYLKTQSVRYAIELLLKVQISPDHLTSEVLRPILFCELYRTFNGNSHYKLFASFLWEFLSVLLYFSVACFWCQSFYDVSPYVCIYYFSSVSVAEWPPFGK